MDERKLASDLHRALGEPPNEASTLQRLQRALADPAGAASGRHEPSAPRGMAVTAGALTLLVLVGLLGTQALRRSHPASSPASHTTGRAVGCLATAPAQLVVIDLSTRRLTAYENGCPQNSSSVTTSGTGLETSVGTYHVLFKSPSQHLTSPWPSNSPNWYPPLTVRYYMAITRSGLALYSFDRQSADAFGAGSENAPLGPQGEVILPLSAAERLYQWAPMGTTVVIEEGGARA